MLKLLKLFIRIGGYPGSYPGGFGGGYPGGAGGYNGYGTNFIGK